MEISIAVASDLHCHHSSVVPAETMLLSDADRSPSCHHPVEALMDLIKKERIRADALVLPGDFSNRIDRQGLISAWDFSRQIAEALEVSLTAATLGNHDVKSRDLTGAPFDAARRLRPHFPTAVEPALDSFWANGFYITESRNLRIVVINSVASHTNKQTAEQGMITTDELSRLETALGSKAARPFQIAVCHHHPILHEDIGLGKADVMENGSLLLDVLGKAGFHLVIHGHKHHPKLSYVSAPSPLPVFAAGSFAAGMRNGLASLTRNLFHVVRLERSGKSAVRGTITTWQFRLSKGWVPSTWLAADFPHRAGFGCYEPPKSVAKRIELAFQAKRSEIVRWSTVVTDVPEVEYLIPGAFEAVGTLLSDVGLAVVPRPPDQPDYIGVTQE